MATIDDELWTVHTVSAPIGATQVCSACGHVLQDNTAWFEGRVMVPEGQERTGPMWWPTGERIAELGACTAVLPGRPLEADERMCAGAN